MSVAWDQGRESIEFLGINMVSIWQRCRPKVTAETQAVVLLGPSCSLSLCLSLSKVKELYDEYIQTAKQTTCTVDCHVVCLAVC